MEALDLTGQFGYLIVNYVARHPAERVTSVRCARADMVTWRSNLKYEPRSRVPDQVSPHRSLCRVIELRRSFRPHIACVFQLRALAVMLCVDGRWPLENSFTELHIDYSFTAVRPYQSPGG